MYMLNLSSMYMLTSCLTYQIRDQVRLSFQALP